MKAIDFEYDSIRLSDFGMMLANFDNGGIDTVNFPEITFNTVSSQGGIRHYLTSAQYDDCATFTLQICKNLCDGSTFEISLQELDDLARWLNRKSFHKFRLIEDDYSGISCNASFNISKIQMDGRIIGIELEGVTDSPFMQRDPVTITFDMDPGVVKDIYNKSDLEGSIYPNLEILIKEDGDFKMKNLFDGREMIIKNCTSQEVITIDYPMIFSSIPSHNKVIMNNFNWIFLKLNSTFKNRLNEFTVSLPCTIKIEYSPIVKVGI